MKVRDIMTARPVTVGQLEPIAAAARLMKRHNLGVLPVCDDTGRLRGVLTDRDIVTRCVAADMDPADTKIREIMSRGVTACRAEDDADGLLRTMGAAQIRRMPVLEADRVVGMVSLGDLARNGRYAMEASDALAEITANIVRRP